MSRIHFLFFLLISVCTFGQKNVKQSIAFEKPPVIDGDVTDWSCDWWLDPDGKFISNVANDAENLYVRLKISDDLTQEKIGLLGLSLKLNPNGKRKGKVGLKYPVGKDESEMRKKPGEDKTLNERDALIQMKKELVSDVEVVELIGLTKQNIVSSRLGLTNGIQAIIIAQNDGSYIYEAKIPFKAFKINKSEVDVLGVEFETGRYIPPAKNQPVNPNIGAMSRGPGSYGYNQQQRYNNSGYQYNAFSSPGYLFLAVKLN
jgi:hypothetical protein